MEYLKLELQVSDASSIYTVDVMIKHVTLYQNNIR